MLLTSEDLLLSVCAYALVEQQAMFLSICDLVLVVVGVYAVDDVLPCVSDPPVTSTRLQPVRAFTGALRYASDSVLTSS
jgi:hypothetical protein